MRSSSCLLCFDGRIDSIAKPALHKDREPSVHSRTGSSGHTTIGLTLLNADEPCEAFNECSDALPCRQIRDATVTVEHATCIRCQHSGIERRSHPEKPHHGQPRRLR